MKKQILCSFFVVALLISFSSCGKSDKVSEQPKDTFVADNYDLTQVDITMRDGVKLHTNIFSPKDKGQKYPILLQRTPYNASPYRKGKLRTLIGPSICNNFIRSRKSKTHF